jgi:signal transduction histidine kinase
MPRRRAEEAEDPELARAAARYRAELEASFTNARRWELVVARWIAVIPFLGILLGALLAAGALRASRSIGRRLSRPVEEMAGWAGMVARREPLPPVRGRAAADEFAVLRDAFRRMAAELEESRRRELEAERARAWVGMARRVAHELKNPLTPIRLALRTLQARGVEGADAREAVEVLDAESARLEELARSFAQVGRLPEGPPSEVDLRELLEYLLRTHLPPRLRGSLRVDPSVPPVRGHPDALSRAFANLLLNAAEAAAGEVAVAVSAAGGEVTVRVLDDGAGIAADPPERVWEPDYTTKSRGTGLGLALVAQTVRAHGGRVWARNRPSGGAEFGVALPRASTL